MNQKTLLNNALTIVEEVYLSDCDLMDFISIHQKYFKGIPLRSLLSNEYAHTNITTESSFIYLIGSYLYFNMAGEPVTWLMRRKYVEFPFSDNWNILFQKTLSSSPTLRFQSSEKLKEYLKDLLLATE